MCLPRSKTLHDPEPAKPRRIGEALIGDLRTGVRPLRIGAPPPHQRRRRVVIAHRIEQPLQTALARIDVKELGRARIHEDIEHETHAGRPIVRSRIGRGIPQRRDRSKKLALVPR